MHARALALSLLAGEFHLQSTILAFRDAFILTTAIVGVGVCIAFFLHPAARQPHSHAEPVIAE